LTYKDRAPTGKLVLLMLAPCLKQLTSSTACSPAPCVLLYFTCGSGQIQIRM